MKIILLLFVITILNGCAILAIKETARVTDIIATDAKDKATNNNKIIFIFLHSDYVKNQRLCYVSFHL